MPLIAVVVLLVFVAAIAGFVGYNTGHTRGSIQSNLNEGDRKMLAENMNKVADSLQQEADSFRESGFNHSAETVQASAHRFRAMAQRVSKGELEAL